ncbi:hypothetical protein C0Q70_14237 [Pomacea canaliculata]|uniref:Tachylectin 2 domain-containing protein n=1 Tax=Pomacea canaliculata TaxID=400727 RepID=A0A2T7NZH1_POMCA|nr:hypothetical protein C0Q70_14237 [Pomacea canaliculata]
MVLDVEGLNRGTYEAPMEKGTKWTLVPGLLKQLDVGTDIVVGVNHKDEIFYRKNITGEHPTGSDWVKLNGHLKHVTVSPHGAIWGVKHENSIWFRNDISLHKPGGTGWQKVDGSLTQISAGLAGVWGVNANDEIFYRGRTYGGHITVGSGWVQLLGKLAYISSGSGVVLGQRKDKNNFLRTEIREGNPTGYDWRWLVQGLDVIEEYGGAIWGVSGGQYIWMSHTN